MRVALHLVGGDMVSFSGMCELPLTFEELQHVGRVSDPLADHPGHLIVADILRQADGESRAVHHVRLVA